MIDVEIRSVSKLSNDSALVRFATSRNDPGAAAQPEENWVAVIRYRYSNAPMTFEDRLVNPLGFEVTSYHKDGRIASRSAAGNNATGPNPAIQPPMPESQPCNLQRLELLGR